MDGWVIGRAGTALATPLRAGELDEATLARLCERQIDRGTTSFFLCGSTGETPALRPDDFTQAEDPWRGQGRGQALSRRADAGA